MNKLFSLFFVIVILLSAIMCSSTDFPEMTPKYISEVDLSPESKKTFSIRENILPSFRSDLKQVYQQSDECINKIFKICDPFVGETAYLVEEYVTNFQLCVFKIMDKECGSFMKTDDIAERFQNNPKLAFNEMIKLDHYLIKGQVVYSKEVDGLLYYYFSVKNKAERYIQIQVQKALSIYDYVWADCTEGEFYFEYQLFNECKLIHHLPGK